MRKFPILPLIALLAAGLTTACENSRPLTEAELPAASQRFLSEHFPGVEISFAKVDTELFDKEYKVVFVTGSKVEFDRRGAWKEIDCKYGEVPSGIVRGPEFRHGVSERRADTFPAAPDRSGKAALRSSGTAGTVFPLRTSVRRPDVRDSVGGPVGRGGSGAVSCDKIAGFSDTIFRKLVYLCPKKGKCKT